MGWGGGGGGGGGRKGGGYYSTRLTVFFVGRRQLSKKTQICKTAVCFCRPHCQEMSQHLVDTAEFLSADDHMDGIVKKLVNKPMNCSECISLPRPYLKHHVKLASSSIEAFKSIKI